MTPTETEVLAPYERLDPNMLVGETITHIYYDSHTFIVVTESKKYIKLLASGHEDGGFDTEPLQAADLRNMEVIDQDTWFQILAERKEKQKVRRRSDTEITVRRLVREHGADKIRDLIQEQQ